MGRLSVIVVIVRWGKRFVCTVRTIDVLTKFVKIVNVVRLDTAGVSAMYVETVYQHINVTQRNAI